MSLLDHLPVDAIREIVRHIPDVATLLKFRECCREAAFVKQILERHPRTRCVVLEKSSEDESGGGRLRMAELNGVEIVQGAGVARQAKDRLLTGIADELGVKARPEVPAKITYSPTFGIPHARAVGFIRGCLSKYRYRASTTFWTYMNDVLGREHARLLSRLLGHTDYLDLADMEECTAISVLTSLWRATAQKGRRYNRLLQNKEREREKKKKRHGDARVQIR